MTVQATEGKRAIRTVEYVRCDKCGSKLRVEDGVLVNPCKCQK